MNTKILENIVSQLVNKPKGILAIDESEGTCNKRFASLSIPQTVEQRQRYRELLITCPGIEAYISGYITFDETLRQTTLEGTPFVDVLTSKGIVTGIKVDQGLVPFNETEEEITKGLDGLEERLLEYKKLGAQFTKWRAVYHVSDTLPSESLMRENAKILAEYAKKVQEADMVPIVEPEVLFPGSHSLSRCKEVTGQNLKIVFEELATLGVYLPGLILKTSMVIAGSLADTPSSVDEVATATIDVLKECVPTEIGGIVFLSGGQTDEVATLHLQRMHELGELPWPLTFSYGRAIQNDALKLFAEGKDEDARQALLVRAKNNSQASIGEYVGNK